MLPSSPPLFPSSRLSPLLFSSPIGPPLHLYLPSRWPARYRCRPGARQAPQEREEADFPATGKLAIAFLSPRLSNQARDCLLPPKLRPQDRFFPPK